MKATGIVRNIDSLGEYSPKVRTQLSIADDTPLEMYVDDEIILQVYRTRCFCDGTADYDLLGQKVCETCLEKVKQL